MKKMELWLALIMVSGLTLTGCKKPAVIVPPALSENQSGASGGGGGGAGGGGAGGGGAGGTAWWDSLTSYSNNVTFKVTPDINDGANASDQDVIASNPFIHEYANNKLIALDNGNWNAPFVRFMSVNSDNTTTVDAVTQIPYDQNLGVIEDNESNIVAFKTANKFVCSKFFKPVGGSSEYDLSLVSFNPTTHAVSVDSFYANDRPTVLALDSNESRIVSIEGDNPNQGELTWKVFDSTILTLGPLASGSINFSSLFPGPAFAVENVNWKIQYANLLRIRNNEFILSMPISVQDNLNNRVYSNLVLVHLNLNNDNSMNADQFKKDFINNANTGNVMQYVDNSYFEVEELHYLRRIDDDHFALTAQFNLSKNVGTWNTNLEDPMIVLGKVESDGSFTTGTPVIIQEGTGGEYGNFWVFQDTNEIIMTYESNSGAKHFLNRNPNGVMPLTNYMYPGRSKDDIGTINFVADFASLPVNPVAIGGDDSLFTTMDNGAFYAWNKTTSAWVQVTQLDATMFEIDGNGFDLWSSSSYGSPLWVLKYDTATLTITQKKLAADLNQTKDYRDDQLILDDLWRFHGVKMNDGRIAVSFTSSGRIKDETNTTSQFMVISK